jgi:hypothetical protein
MRQTMAGDVTVSLVGLPLLSRAGVNRARLVSSLQVALSSEGTPLDETTEQPVTLPPELTSSRTRTVPVCWFLRASDG